MTAEACANEQCCKVDNAVSLRALTRLSLQMIIRLLTQVHNEDAWQVSA